MFDDLSLFDVAAVRLVCYRCHTKGVKTMGTDEQKPARLDNLLDYKLPDGTPLREATHEKLIQTAEFFGEVARRMKPDVARPDMTAVSRGKISSNIKRLHSPTPSSRGKGNRAGRTASQ